MQWVIIGLGNPGNEYAQSRHNVGRKAVQNFAEAMGMEPDEWIVNAKSKYTSAECKLAKDKCILLLPDTFMNKSGDAVRKFVKSQKDATRMVVVYDDLDLPVGVIKISFDRSSGGHNGLDSIIKAVKTTKFARIRIGVASVTSGGNIKKPHGEEEVIKHILGSFRPNEILILKGIYTRAVEALRCVIERGYVTAMNEFNRL